MTETDWGGFVLLLPVILPTCRLAAGLILGFVFSSLFPVFYITKRIFSIGICSLWLRSFYSRYDNLAQALFKMKRLSPQKLKNKPPSRYVGGN